MGNKFRGAFYSRGSLISRKHEIKSQWGDTLKTEHDKHL